ncbi:formimidoylglutamase [Janibacter hoylei]|uniref:formimidoylglutamase n=1 Tax=Janibacter hoylei TaxID=364298 RepID=UPI0021A64AE6|nr:formimidoylglutamase [Janibacter hoylei]MCT1618048.1 formimidoylglutamase [Janibacter hoylei]MCT2291717.1 formimidoylglutamase [Janibacter hoylei]
MAPFAWSGRSDGDGPAHRRFWGVVAEPGSGRPADAALIGFASDEGVRRNRGRVGAAEGPGAIRAALASLAVHEDLTVVDHGDVVVDGEDLEGGHARLGEVVAAAREGAPAAARDDAPLTVVLGGGHETAYGSHLGLGLRPGLGVLNLDAHFDLREADRPTSGTPFRQIARERQAAGLGFDYAVLGIARTGNTSALFDTAEALGTRWLLDDDSQQVEPAVAFVGDVLAGVDEVYLTIDLDVLPAAVAPGVSAPAALGVPPFVIQSVCDAVVDSGKLIHLDVTELSPRLDVDQRTARVAARLIHRVITREAARRRSA